MPTKTNPPAGDVPSRLARCQVLASGDHQRPDIVASTTTPAEETASEVAEPRALTVPRGSQDRPASADRYSLRAGAAPAREPTTGGPQARYRLLLLGAIKATSWLAGRRHGGWTAPGAPVAACQLPGVTGPE